MLVNEDTSDKDTANGLYDATFLDIRRVEPCVCFWPSCFSGPTSLSTVMLQSASLMSLVVLPVFHI